MPTILYRSTDAGATQMDYTNVTTPVGRFYQAIKAIFFDGYGTRTPAGNWTLAFDDPANNKLVMRHKSGTRFLRIDDNNSSILSSVRGYRTMTDIDTGTDPFPSQDQVSDDGPLFPTMTKRYDNSLSTDRPWDCVVDADGDWFYWICYDGSLRADAGAYFFGKLNNLPGDTDGFRFHNAINPNTYASTIGFQDYLFRINSSVSFSQYADQAVNGAKSVRMGTGLNGQATSTPFDEIQELGRKFLVPLYVREVTSSAALGSFPDLWTVYLNNPLPLFNPSEYGELITSNGQTYLLLAVHGTFWLRVDTTTG